MLAQNLNNIDFPHQATAHNTPITDFYLPSVKRASTSKENHLSSTSTDTSSLSSIVKYKTELCKNYSLTGRCPYLHKCRFAHGSSQLISQNLEDSHQRFRTKKCKSFWQQGFCNYGSRCKFQHESVLAIGRETKVYLSTWKMVFQRQCEDGDSRIVDREGKEIMRSLDGSQ